MSEVIEIEVNLCCAPLTQHAVDVAIQRAYEAKGKQPDAQYLTIKIEDIEFKGTLPSLTVGVENLVIDIMKHVPRYKGVPIYTDELGTQQSRVFVPKGEKDE